MRFCGDRGQSLVEVVATDIFDYLEWQTRPRRGGDSDVVVRLDGRRGAAPATMNRRVAAVRGLFDYAVLAGVRPDNPVPAAAARRVCGQRGAGCWGTLARAGAARAGGWCGNLDGCRSR